MRTYLLTLLMMAGLVSQSAFGQGIIRGTVTESASGLEVIGGNVKVISESDDVPIGASTDFDGKYSIEGLPAGTYTLECTYIGFAPQRITDIKVADGEVTLVNFQMQEAGVEIIQIEITARNLGNTEASMLTRQKKAGIVMDGISAAQISKSGDSDVAGAVQRIPGVTVEGGKYVYVRGLGDRYSKSLVNGAEVPSLDPERNTVQMDLFPTNLIDNVTVYKTFSPNLPGSFTGGCVDIETKSFPDDLVIGASLSMGAHSIAHFQPDAYQSYKGGSLDWLGFDDGLRQLPESAFNSITNPNYSQDGSSPTSAEQTELIRDYTRDFEQNDRILSLEDEAEQSFTSRTRRPMLNTGASFSYGNRFKVFGKDLGVIVGATYSNNHTAYIDGASGRYQLNGLIDNARGLTGNIILDDSRAVYNSIWGTLGNFSLKLNEKNKLSLTLMHNQSGEKTFRSQSGNNLDEDSDLYITEAWLFEQRGMSTAQFSGEHVLERFNKLKIDWNASVSSANQSQPDWRFFTYEVTFPTNSSEDSLFEINPANGQLPTRYFRNMNQINADGKVDFTLPFENNPILDKVQFGAGRVTKIRSFRERQYRYNSGVSQFSGNLQEYISPDNYVTWTGTGPDNGVYISDFFETPNNYIAQEDITTGYAMAELSLLERGEGKNKRFLRLITGLRTEATYIRLDQLQDPTQVFVSFNENNPTGDLATDLRYIDFLPALNMNYSTKGGSMNYRLGYSRTLARPTFRELAPFVSFSFIGDYLFQGNPNLERTLIDNFDARWEWYPNTGEIFSLSGFFKNFQNPIERVNNIAAANQELTLRNVDNAWLAGAEFEVRKKLGFLGKWASDFNTALNFSYIYSQTTIDPQEFAEIILTVPDASETRPMFGQSPYVINALLSYEKAGWMANLSYNISGPRLSIVVRGGTPNIYELPRNMLNFNISKEITQRFTVKASVANLLDARMQQAHTFDANGIFDRYFYQDNALGQMYNIKLSYNFDRQKEQEAADF